MLFSLSKERKKKKIVAWLPRKFSTRKIIAHCSHQILTLSPRLISNVKTKETFLIRFIRSYVSLTSNLPSSLFKSNSVKIKELLILEFAEWQRRNWHLSLSFLFLCVFTYTRTIGEKERVWSSSSPSPTKLLGAIETIEKNEGRQEERRQIIC